MSPDVMPSFAPALMLLALLLAAAWGVKWLRQRYAIGGSSHAQTIKIVSSLAVGPQQRVVVLELTEPDGQGRHLLTVGVTPGQITPLHSTAFSSPASTLTGTLASTPSNPPARTPFQSTAAAVAAALPADDATAKPAGSGP